MSLIPVEKKINQLKDMGLCIEKNKSIYIRTNSVPLAVVPQMEDLITASTSHTKGLKTIYN